MKRWLCAQLVILGCSGPAPIPPSPAPAAAPPPAAPLHTDAERIDRIVTTPGFIWGLTAEGPIRWNRQTGQAIHEGRRGAPADATAIAVAADGLYFGTPSGLTWQDPRGQWRRFDEAPARAGVIDLEPRAAGGVWLATPNAIAAFVDGRATTRAERYRVRDVALDPQGGLWLATQGHGVVALQGETWVEHTTAEGVCGNHVRHVAIAPGGRLVATCAETPTLAVREGGRWAAYRLGGVGPTLLAAWPQANTIIVRTPTRWFRMRLGAATGAPRPLTVAAFDPTGIPAPAAPTPAASAAPPPAIAVPVPVSAAPVPVKVQVIAPPSAAPPAPPSRYPASVPPDAAAPPEPPEPPSAPMRVIVKPPPVPMPPPVAPLPRTVEVFESVRAGAAVMAQPPAWLLEDAADLLPADDAPSASTVTVDGVVLHALPYRGVEARSGATRRRYVTGSLLPAAPSRLEVDQAGRLVILTAEGALLRFDGQRFSPWRLPGDLRAIGIAAGTGPAYALAWAPPPPPPAPDPTAQLDSQVTPTRQPARLIVFRSDTQGPFTEVARIALPIEITDPPRIGRIVVQGATLSFPLFTAPTPNDRRAVGLAHIRDAFARLELWTGRLGYVEDEAKGAIYLPDAWVNALAIAPDGVQYVATNAGLVRIAGRSVTVFDENAFIDSEVIVDVAVDRAGAVWAGTLEGLGTLVDGKWQAVKQPGLEGRINAVATTTDGSVWVGTAEGLWQRTPAGVWEKATVRGRRDAVEVRDMVPTGKGGLWILTAEGIVRRD